MIEQQRYQCKDGSWSTVNTKNGLFMPCGRCGKRVYVPLSNYKLYVAGKRKAFYCTNRDECRQRIAST